MRTQHLREEKLSSGIHNRKDDNKFQQKVHYTKANFSIKLKGNIRIKTSRGSIKRASYIAKNTMSYMKNKLKISQNADKMATVIEKNNSYKER